MMTLGELRELRERMQAALREAGRGDLADMAVLRDRELIMKPPAGHHWASDELRLITKAFAVSWPDSQEYGSNKCAGCALAHQKCPPDHTDQRTFAAWVEDLDMTPQSPAYRSAP